jgi:hypothetical protein
MKKMRGLEIIAENMDGQTSVIDIPYSDLMLE